MSEKKYKEFGIADHEYPSDVYYAYPNSLSLDKHTKTDREDCLHVIEHAAYTELLTEARKLREALEIEMGNSGTRQAEEALSNFDAKYPSEDQVVSEENPTEEKE